MSSPLK